MWAANILAAREKAELSQAQLAKLVGITQTAVSQWEQALTAPTTEMQARVAYVLKVAPHRLFPHPNASPTAFV